MVFDGIFFAFSMLACCVIIYIITMLWFSNTHSRQMRSFLGFGAAAAVWIFFSAIASVAAPQYFVFLYTAHAVTGCVFPYVFLWYALNFCNSRLVKSKTFISILVAVPILDALFFATNPDRKSTRLNSSH